MTDTGFPIVCVATPVYNEQGVVTEFVNQVSSVLDSLPNGGAHRIVVVDDGSTDQTLDELRKLVDCTPRLTVVALSRNFGHQAALSAALEYAVGDAIITMDGDLQDDPEMIPALLEKHREGFDVVYAIRTGRKESMLLRAGYSLYYRLMARLSKPKLPVDAGDFALMSRRVVDAIIALSERGRYLRGLRAWVGFSQVGIPIERHVRHAGQTKYTLGKLLNLAFDGLFSFSTIPIRAALFVGSMVLGTGAVYSAYALAVRIVSGAPPPGFTGLLVITTLLGGAILFFLGVIGEYVGRIYEEVKARPVYVVDTVFREEG